MEMVTMTMAHLVVELSDTWGSSTKTTHPFGLLLGARHQSLCLNLELLKVLFCVSDLVADFQICRLALSTASVLRVLCYKGIVNKEAINLGFLFKCIKFLIQFAKISAWH